MPKGQPEPAELGADARNILGIPAKGREAHPKLTGTLLAAVAAAAPAVRVFPGTSSTLKTMGRVLVLLTIVSTVNGWDPPHSPHELAITGRVDGARDRRQLASGSLFAVITATKNAETLPYGPGPISAAVPYFCTDCIDTPSDSWTETVACNGYNVDMTLVYKFDSAMSVVDRMRQCSATGCNVGFTVSGPGITTTSFNSDWWFTDATVLPSTSGSGVSSDDGMWGGAPGMVNGNKGRGARSCYGNTHTGVAGFYGFGNCDGGDSQGATVYYGPNGSTQCPRLKAQLYATPH